MVEKNEWSRINDQQQMQIDGLKAGLRRYVGTAITEGGPFNGLKQIATQKIPGAGVAFNFAQLQQTIDLVSASCDNGLGYGANALFMSLRSRQSIINTLLSLGLQPQWALSAVLGVPVLMWNGIPIYIADINDDPPTTGTIYAVRLKTPGCSSGMYLAYAGGDGEGIIVEEFGAVRAELSAYQKAVYMYTVLVVPSDQSLAEYEDFDQV